MINQKSHILRLVFITTVFLVFHKTAWSQKELDEAKLLQRIYFDDKCRNEALFKKVEKKYLLVLQKDSTNIDANKGLSYHYRCGAKHQRDMIEENKDKWSEKRIKSAVTKAYKLMTKSYPYAERYYRLKALTNP